MEIADDDTRFLIRHRGRTLLFCSDGCAERFNRDPERYPEFEGLVPASSFDLVIIGGGPAGLTAAVYASIQRLRALLVTEVVGGQAIDSTQIQNYMGFSFISGPSLVERFRDQLLQDHYLEHRLDTVTTVRASDHGYLVCTQRGDEINAKVLVVATGMKRRRLGVPGEERLQRRGVCYTAVQDSGLFHRADVVVVGGGNSGLQAAADLARVARRVVLVSTSDLTGDPDDIERVSSLPNVEVRTHSLVLEILGADKVEAILIESSSGGQPSRLSVSGVVITIGFIPNSDSVRSLVDCNERGEVIIQPDCSTTMPGIFAAGDVTDAYGKRVIIASGEGAKAALAASQYLQGRRRG